jgi:predicted amidohydrolase YtcJ
MRIDAGTERMAKASLEMGGRVAVHAIGDRANGAVLDLYESLIDGGADPGDLRIEHVSVITGRDIERLADLGVTAVVQPAFLMSEVDWLEGRVGIERIDRTYAFRSLLEAGVPLAGSSDCPVEPPSPWWGIAAARDRAGLTPAERLNPAQAFGLFTSDAAVALGAPQLEVGRPCDLAIVDRDPLEADPDELRATEVVATWREGEPVPTPGDLKVWAVGSIAG